MRDKSAVAGLPVQDPLKAPPKPSTTYRLMHEGGALQARGGPLNRSEKRQYQLGCDEIRKQNRNIASLKADFLLKFNVSDGVCDEVLYEVHCRCYGWRAKDCLMLVAVIICIV